MKKTIYTALSFCIYSLFFAQQNSNISNRYKVDFLSSTTNMPLQVSFDESLHLSDQQFFKWMNQEMTKNEEISFSSLKIENDNLGSWLSAIIF